MPEKLIAGMPENEYRAMKQREYYLKNHPKTDLHRTCPFCGTEFEAPKVHPNTIYCSKKCCTKASAHRNKPSVKKQDAKQLMLGRLAERDAAYAAWEEANGIRPRIVESSGVVTEIRGTCCAGHRAASLIIHN